jgi:uncharacterized membrane protein
MVNIKKLRKGSEATVDISRQLGNQYVHMFKMMEKMRELDSKVNENHRLLKEMYKKYVKMGEKKVKTIPYRTKTRSAIKLILKKQGKMTSNQLCKMIGLSRTRCNEYLKDLENRGEATSEVINRRKFYMLKK